MIYLFVTNAGIVAPVVTHKKLDVSFERAPKSPSTVLFVALRACVHIPSCTKDGSESLFNPLVKLWLIF